MTYTYTFSFAAFFAMAAVYIAARLLWRFIPWRTLGRDLLLVVACMALILCVGFIAKGNTLPPAQAERTSAAPDAFGELLVKLTGTGRREKIKPPQAERASADGPYKKALEELLKTPQLTPLY